MAEEWRPVAGYEGMYEVSNLGRVRSLARTNPVGRRVRERILSAAPDTGGYLRVVLTRNAQAHTIVVHRLVLAAFAGPAPEGTQGCHNDGNLHNNALSNLRWDTRSANVRDQVSHGTHHMARKTHCPQGHPYDEANTYISNRGDRQCRSCARMRWRARKDDLASTERTHARKEQHAHPVNPT